MTEPKCLKCGGMIEYDDCLDTEHGMGDEDVIICLYVGHCIECNTDYSWKEEYKFDKIKELLIEGE